MRLISVPDFKKRSDADTIIVPYWEAHPPKKASQETVVSTELLALGDFKGKQGETLLAYPGKGKEKRVLLLGLGKKSKVKAETIRLSYASAIRALHSKKSSTINVLIPDAEPYDLFLRAAVEGMLLANYKYLKLKEDTKKDHPHHPINTARVIGSSKKDLPVFSKAKKLVGAVNFARDLVNQNADEKSPQVLGEIALSLGQKFPNLKTEILKKKDLEKEKMGLLLAVGRSAKVDPNMIIMSYKGDPDDTKSIACIGKGVVYDTGGLSLKPTSNMLTMKSDMGGAAAVFGIIAAAAMMNLKKNIIGVIPCTENAIGGDSFKPGDVYRSYSGKTVEITNTDAEGRLILADAISYVQERFKPTQMMDFATLTGGVVVALGDEIMGYYTDDKKFIQGIDKASQDTGELAWRLPMHTPYRKLLKSDVADIKNSGARTAHSIQGALFLHDFWDKKTPWAHFDIAGPAYLDTAVGFHPQFGTGSAVRLVVSLIEDMS
jgi:leucyl aminopeptidase